MNKELPLKVRNIFSDLDPIIWKNEWLIVLNKLLASSEMLEIWPLLIDQANKNKNNFPAIGNSQFLKWELKAFVAHAVKLAKENTSKSDFMSSFRDFFHSKRYIINNEQIAIIYEAINN